MTIHVKDCRAGRLQQQRNLQRMVACMSELNTRKNKLIKKGKYRGAGEEIKEKELLKSVIFFHYSCYLCVFSSLSFSP